MALNCALTLSRLATAVGQNPPPMLLLTVYNTAASAVVVTGVQVTFWDTVGNQLRNASVVPPSVAFGPGATTSVPATDDIDIGPFPIVVASAANGNAYEMVPPSDQPSNMQLSQPLVWDLVIGATVFASDGTVNEASRTMLRISPQSTPPLGFQGGFANFSDGNNANLTAAGVG